MPYPNTHSKEFLRLSAALDALVAVDAANLDDTTAGDDKVELFRIAARVDARNTASLARVRSQLRTFQRWRGGAAAWLRWKCHLAPGAACERGLVSRRLPNLPATEGALAAGDISYRHAALIAQATAELSYTVGRPGDHRADPAAGRALATRRFCARSRPT